MQLERTRIEIVDCAKTYPDGTRGLLPTTLTIEPGEVIALLGPSGCGKTTLLRLLAGLEAADPGGRIVFGDQDVTARPVEKRGVGMVFQSYALFPQMTVAANIGYGLKVRGVDEAERRRAVGELVDLVRLNGLESRRPPDSSAGRSRCGRACCCSTSRSSRSDSFSFASSAASWPSCCAGSASRQCTSPTTSTRRSRSPTASR